MRTSTAFAILVSLGFAGAIPTTGAVEAITPVVPDATGQRSQGFEEILVTARRRTESIQQVPMSVTALTGEELARRGVLSIEETFDYTPNVTYEMSGFNTSSRVYIRGIGNAGAHFATGDPSVALYVDGVYQARAATGIFDVLDLERVEVLRGPQGTLFGRNSTGGAIQVITRSPEPTYSADTSLSVGNDGYSKLSAVGNAPLADNLYVRGGASWAQRDGYTENQVDGSDWNNLRDVQARAALRYEATEDLTLDLVGHYTKKHQRSAALRCEWDPAPTATGPFLLGAFQLLNTFIAACNDSDQADPSDSFSNLEGTSNIDFGGVTATATWETGVGTLTSITAWQKLKERRDTEADGTAFPYFDVYGLPYGQHQYSQEFRFNGSAFGDRLEYVTGIYGLTENGEEDAVNCLLPVGSPILPPGLLVTRVIGGCTQRERDFQTDTVAVFGEGTYHLTDRIELTAGIRRTIEDKTFGQTVQNVFTGAVTQNQSDDEVFKAWTPRFTGSYAFTDDLLVYASWSEGYKSGGFNGASPLLAFAPEVVKMYEVGVKSEWFDRRLQINVAAFDGDYDNMQLLVTRATTTGQFLLALTNAAASSVRGAELEMQALATDNLALGVSFGYTDAEYDEFINVNPGTGAGVDLSENEFPSTPEYNYSLFADFSFGLGDLGTGNLRADWADQTKTYMEIDNIDSVAQENRELLSASFTVTLPDGKSQVSLWGKNLLDSEYIAWGQTTRTSLGYNASWFGPPRWYGLTVTYRMGE